MMGKRSPAGGSNPRLVAKVPTLNVLIGWGCMVIGVWD
ncbi:hypothetical protein NSP_38200 [Nodularia spumigena CCY9414]|nr:hypothetical protein NSP_38200 [Nodularia spumigena CCY9414]